jgi:hypothetical protein
VIEKISYQGTAAGDSNGRGEFLLSAGGTRIAHYPEVPLPFKEVWQGSIAIHSGEEDSVFLEVANSSTGDVLIEGRFEEAPH